MDDLSDVIDLLTTGTYTVERSGPARFIGGRHYRSVFAPPWAPNTVYALGARVLNGGEAYEATQAGTSAAAGGPTGTGSGIVDNTVRWKWIGPAATQISVAACVQPLSGRELDRLPELLRQRELRVVFASTELYGTSDAHQADQITIDNEQWQVQTVESWATVANYYRVIVARVGR